MPEYIVNLWLDGYDTEEQMEEACGEFIYEQLNFTASSVRVKRSDYATLLARYNALNASYSETKQTAEYCEMALYERTLELKALREAVAWLVECEYFDRWATQYHYPVSHEWVRVVYYARADVDRILEEK